MSLPSPQKSTSTSVVVAISFFAVFGSVWRMLRRAKRQKLEENDCKKSQAGGTEPDQKQGNEKPMRMFIAIKPSKEFVEHAFMFTNEKVPGVNWTSLENLHITLQFLGDVLPSEKPDLIERIRKGVKESPFKLHLDGIIPCGSRTIRLIIDSYPMTEPTTERHPSTYSETGQDDDNKEIEETTSEKPNQSGVSPTFISTQDLNPDPSGRRNAEFRSSIEHPGSLIPLTPFQRLRNDIFHSVCGHSFAADERCSASGHVTLARLKNADMEWVVEYVARYEQLVKEDPFPMFDVNEVHLIQSIQHTGQYIVDTSFPLLSKDE